MPKKATKTTKKTTKKGNYSASSIQVLEGLEPVRKRPGMYIGTTGPDGLHHLIWEVFDNSRDEAMGGFADRVEVALLPGNYIRVVDNGRGIPVDKHKQTKTSALETILTTLHAGGKFGGEGYKVSGGLHGVGVSVVNALSTHLIAEVHRDGGYFIQEYNIGKQKAKIKKVSASKLKGTIITFQADDSIFNEVVYDWKRIVSHMRQQAYLVKGMRITVIDARELNEKDQKQMDVKGLQYLSDLHLEVPSETFYFESGLRSLVAFNNQHQKPVHKNIFYVEKGGVDEMYDDKVQSVEIALQYVDDISARISAFANNTYNSEHGTHVTGFKTALTRTLNNYAKKNNIIRDKEGAFTGDDVLEGITVVISVKMPDIQFEGQTKAKLGSVEARGAVESVFSEAFTDFLEENPNDAKAMINKVVIAVKARKAAKAAKDSVLRKGALEGMTLPGKLADCQTKSAEESELFVVEGDSAGGCFSGDTEVALTDGRSLSFKKLVREYQEGKRNYCYTITSEEDITIAEIQHPRVTKRDASLVRVTFDSGTSVVCTPDHKFMQRDGSYQEAQGLTEGTSLMPLYRKHSRIGGAITIDGYEMVQNPKDTKWIFTHVLADAVNIKDGVYQQKDKKHIHHKDFNKYNNNPNNLIQMSPGDHLALHRKHCERTLHTAESKDRARRAHQTDAYRKKMSQRMKRADTRALLSSQAKKQWENPEYKEYMHNKYTEFYNNNPEYQKENRAQLDRAQQIHWSSKENRNQQSLRTKEFFAQHPARRKELSEVAKEQWTDTDLLEWRREKTKNQWTDDFRLRRKIAYNQTYLRKALEAFNKLYYNEGIIDYDGYNKIRKQTNDKSLLRSDTIVSRFFDGDTQQFEEAVTNFNHKVAHVENLNYVEDVYDIEVANTHNFALANGVFVHNSAKMGRDRRTQAILPLRGKILNVERARLDKMLASEQIKNLVIAMGTAIGDIFDIEKLRYHKIIIATDADVDGAHIRTLLLTLFYRYFKEVIEGGYLYIAQPPLYKIQKGKEVTYVYTEEEKIALVGTDTNEDDSTEDADTSEEEEEEEVSKTKSGASKIRIQRYKGLGEMNAEELWDTTMNPENRILKQVTIEDANEADKIFDVLMGTDVPSRKSFIQTNAKLANIDV